MIEFVTSRAMMILCGALLVSTVAVPLGQMMDSDEDSRLSGLAISEAESIDGFYDSALDEMYIDGTAVLPSCGYVMTITGNVLVLHSPEGREYTAAIAHPADEITVRYGETVTIYRNGKGISTEPDDDGDQPDMPVVHPV